MNDSEFLERVIALLEEVKEPLTTIAVFIGFIMFTMFFIGLILFFSYYDKELARKTKDKDDKIRRIVCEEKNKE